ncbi:MAG: DUF4147 domain-containing protein [Anaerolineae bacterium]
MTSPREMALSLAHAALAAVEPAAAVRAHVRREADTLIIDGRRYDMAAFDRVFIVGAGKASAPMAAALADSLGDRLTGGWVNVKYGHELDVPGVTIHPAGHPVPDAAGVTGSDAIARIVAAAGARDLILCAISGGGSALTPLPVAGVSLADLQVTTDVMLRSGATINELNCLRKHLDRLKGGGMARLAGEATLVALILSDVVGNPLDVISSGPTVPDTTTFADVARILDERALWERLPASVAAHLRAGLAGEVPDTPKAGDPAFARVQNVIVGSNGQAAAAALAVARAHGLNTLLLSTYVEGEAREVARVCAAIAREMADTGQPIPRPACVVLGGETTVTVRGAGKGGRNQELALAAAPGLAGLDNVMLLTLATDGTDGPTDAAGAFVDGTTMRRAAALGLDGARYLADNDAYTFFERLGDLLITGPTRTNVNDLTFILAL